MGCYAYLWLNESGIPYYAGQGTLRRALYTHHRKIKAPIDRSRIAVFSRSSKDEAIRTEMELISNWGRRDIGTGCLLNQSDGGQGGGLRNHCARGPHKISSKGLEGMRLRCLHNIGRKHSPETIMKMRISHKQIGGRKPGFKHSEETRARMRHPHKGRKTCPTQ